MCRATTALLVLTSLSSTALARRLPAPDSQNFAQPPSSLDIPAIVDGDQPAPSEVQFAPPNIRPGTLAPTRAQVRAALAKARAQNLASFRAYYKAGVYPNNTFSKKELNVWRDDAGHFCAAATIMVKSGNNDLAIQIAEQNNFIKLADVKQGSVKDWITMSGFTQAELVLIQKPFRPVTAHPQMPQVDGDPPAIAISTGMRKQETARLRALYKQVDAKLVAAQKKSLDAATTLLMKNPELASKLVIEMNTI